MEYPKPVIILSACLDGDPVRYNREILHNEFVEKLKNFVVFKKVCPEISIGLGVPRNPIKIYFSGDTYRLYQSKTKTDVTERMKEFSKTFLENLEEVDGFLLKGKSPSCGYSGTKIYRDKNAKDILKRGSGLFAMAVKERFPDIPCEDELRLNNDELRHHFFTRIFALAQMRDLKKNIRSISRLIEFHSRYKYLLMLYNQSKLIQLGRIVAGYKKGNLLSTVSDYSKIFYAAFSKKPGTRRHINVINHIYGYFSHRLNTAEKKHFLSLVKKYSEDKIQYEVLLEILRNLALHFDTQYLFSQVYFNPYPEQLNA